MSIHNKEAVPDEETHESSSYTRDRFQKKHRISNDDGTSRVRRIKKNLAMMALLSAAQLLCHSGVWAAEPRRNTNISVDSSELDATDLDARLNAKMNLSKDEKFGIYMNDSTALDFNEDGDPNLRMRY
jgi:hypothetical protein